MNDARRSFDLKEYLNNIHCHLNNDDIQNSDYLLRMRKEFAHVVTRIDIKLLRDHKHQSEVQKFFDKR